MRYIFTNRNLPAGNPIANAIVIIVGSIAILASIVVGFFAAVVLGAALLILAAFIGIRIWWLRRKMSGSGVGSGPGTVSRRAGSETIEGEYRIVIDERDESER